MNDNHHQIDHYKIMRYWLGTQTGGEYELSNGQTGGEYKSDEVMNEQTGGEYKWTTLHHNGVLFPPLYKKHNIPVIYNNEEIVLDEKSEEYATLYTKYLETEYIKSKVFNKNFWHDWKKILGKDHKIQSLEECNFQKIYNYFLNENMKKRSTEGS